MSRGLSGGGLASGILVLGKGGGVASGILVLGRGVWSVCLEVAI